MRYCSSNLQAPGSKPQLKCLLEGEEPVEFVENHFCLPVSTVTVIQFPHALILLLLLYASYCHTCSFHKTNIRTEPQNFRVFFYRMCALIGIYDYVLFHVKSMTTNIAKIKWQ